MFRLCQVLILAEISVESPDECPIVVFGFSSPFWSFMIYACAGCVWPVVVNWDARIGHGGGHLVVT